MENKKNRKKKEEVEAPIWYLAVLIDGLECLQHSERFVDAAAHWRLVHCHVAHETGRPDQEGTAQGEALVQEEHAVAADERGNEKQTEELNTKPTKQANKRANKRTNKRTNNLLITTTK
jgi:sRNA-binding protein